MKLVIMTKSTFFVEEDKILASLFDEGMDNLHLFKPDSSPVLSERLLTLLPEEYYRKITPHQHYYLKGEYRLAGIHIEQADEPLPAGYKGKVGRTCRDISRLKEMKKKSDYVFLGRLFPSIYNEDEPVISQQELTEASRHGLIDRHVYALGGMRLENIQMARDLGFGGVVVCDDLWKRFDIHSEGDFNNIIDHFGKLLKATE